MKLQLKGKPKEPLHTRMRPKSFDAVIGQSAVVKSLKAANSTHAVLLSGPSGTGKTTLGRLISKGELIEIDAATNSGIDAMRGLVEVVRTPNVFSDKNERTVIIDECHRLSKPTWDSLLKIIEEPPAHLYWVFCTTELGKVPKTIVSRCDAYNLKPVPWDTIEKLLIKVADDENIKVSEDMIALAAKKANGSVRQALSYLSVLNGVTDKKEALSLMESAEENKTVIDFVRYLAFSRERTWGGAQEHLKGIKEEEIEAESVRITVVNYVAACVLGAKNEKEAQRLLHILAAFSEPYNSTDKYGPLLLSTGNCILQ